MCGIWKITLFSIVAGIAVTTLTGLVANTTVIGEFPEVRFLSIPLLGAGYWGMPLPWVKQIVYPGAPKDAIWPNLLADVVFWVIFAAVLKLFYLKALAKPAARMARPRARRRKARRRNKAMRRRR